MELSWHFKERFSHVFRRPWTRPQLRALTAVENVLHPDPPELDLWWTTELPRGGGATSILLASVIYAIEARVARYVLIVAKSTLSAEILNHQLENEWNSDPLRRLDVGMVRDWLHVRGDGIEATVRGLGQRAPLRGLAWSVPEDPTPHQAASEGPPIEVDILRPDFVAVDNSVEFSSAAERWEFRRQLAGVFGVGRPQRVIEFQTD